MKNLCLEPIRGSVAESFGLDRMATWTEFRCAIEAGSAADRFGDLRPRISDCVGTPLEELEWLQLATEMQTSQNN
jgi:hypothetical protein